MPAAGERTLEGSTPAIQNGLERGKNILRTPGDPDSLFGHTDATANPNRLAFRSGPVDTTSGLVDVPAEALRPTLLWRLFKSGARAVRVLNDGAVPQLWHDLMPASDSARETALGEVLPWTTNLQSLARNHHPSPCVGQMVGDVLFARPPVLTYVARKMVVYARDASSDLVLEPGVIHQEGGTFRLPQTTVRSVWELGTRLLEALSPPGWTLSRPAVALERLWYDPTPEELHRRVQLVRSGLGPFAQLGHRLDAYWADAAGLFQNRALRAAYSLGRLLPKLSPLLERLNQHERAQFLSELLPDGAEYAGEAHTDARLFSCLTSRRDGIRTEFLTEDGWSELPLSEDALVIFPGDLARQHVGLESTRHRILHTGKGTREGTNTTLLVGLAPL